MGPWDALSLFDLIKKVEIFSGIPSSGNDFIFI